MENTSKTWITSWFHITQNKDILLGSKELGTNVFRTLMCIVGKSWSKQGV